MYIGYYNKVGIINNKLHVYTINYIISRVANYSLTFGTEFTC